MKKLLVGIVWMGLLAACGNGDPKNQSTSGRAKTENDSLFRVNKGNFHFSIFLPRDLMITHSPEIGINGATGTLGLRIGPDFHLLALPGDAGFEEMKARLADDGVFTNRVIIENQESLLYQQFLPDSTPYFFHFMGVRELSGRSLAFRSHPDGQFTQEQAERMMNAFMSVTP